MNQASPPQNVQISAQNEWRYRHHRAAPNGGSVRDSPDEGRLRSVARSVDLQDTELPNRRL
jgi:hypothetical protein